MIFTETRLRGSFIIEPEPFGDERGWFARTYDRDEFRKIGVEKEWMQLNHSFTRLKGTVRGMHFQLAPFTEVKLVRCVAGIIYDVLVDIRQGSETFLQHVAVELSASNKKMLCIPEGFAHGFQALTNDCELIYHHTATYQPGVEGGLDYRDPALAINWPLQVTLLSQRDQAHPPIDKNFKGL